MWGDVYAKEKEEGGRRTFTRKGKGKRTFVEFVLEPIYKIYGGEKRKEREGERGKVIFLAINSNSTL